jgi:hypothetical protein
MYGISKRSFGVAFRTFISVFPNASFLVRAAAWSVCGYPRQVFN